MSKTIRGLLVKEDKEPEFINYLISWIFTTDRTKEDCKKSIRDIQNYSKTVSDIEKLLRYAILDYEDLLMNIGLEFVDDVYTYPEPPPPEARLA